MNGQLVQEMNRRNLAQLLRAYEPKDLGRVLAEVLSEEFGAGRAETILIDGQAGFRR